ncbi:hypothetical protein L1994_02695 [Methanomicrobium antiquum]|uniref:Uncharacterized protein n=1 Tax=Methanomicrobium antiquum TaxID=487686 RepID=A0AAF0FPN3_9EURY|nr:hypothetical protein [Methanomicrobium antiquum]WFN37312.1 hypothetical protein L1994_02695 [Methanomicrobium antiquum]
MGNPPPTPPVVTLVNPSGSDICDPVGTMRTFTASCDQPAIMKIYLGVSLLFETSSTVQQISYAFQSAPVGSHVVRVVAENANGSGENYWNWNVLSTPPVVTRVDPGEQEITDLINTMRRFEASVDQNALMKVYIDDFLVCESEYFVRNISCTFNNTILGNFVVKITADNTNGSGETTWNWHIRSADSPVVTLIKPVSEDITDQIGSPRTFIASANQPAYLEFAFNGLPVCKKRVIWENYPCSFKFASRSAGDHKVEVTAVNANGRDKKHWNWHLTNPTSCIENDLQCKGYDLYKCINGQWTVYESNSPQCGWSDPLTLRKIQHYVDLFCHPTSPKAAAVSVSTDPFHSVSIETYDFKSYTYSGTVKYKADRIYRNIEVEPFVYQLYLFAGDPYCSSVPITAENIGVNISNVKPSVNNLVNNSGYNVEAKPIRDIVKPVSEIQKITGIHPDTQGYILKISVLVNWYELMVAFPDAEFSVEFDLQYTITMRHSEPQVNTFVRHWAYSGNDNPLIQLMMMLAGFCNTLETIPATANWGSADVVSVGLSGAQNAGGLLREPSQYQDIYGINWPYGYGDVQ